MLQKPTNKFMENEIRFVDYRNGVWKEGELDECSQKVLTTSYKINKYYGCPL